MGDPNETLLAPLEAEERGAIRSADEGGVVEQLAESAQLRQWLTWFLSLWGEQLPALSQEAGEMSAEVRAWAWWQTRLSLAQQVGIARLVWGGRGYFPLLYQIAQNYSRQWLASLDTMSPAALWQSVLFARELSDPWSTALRDSRFFESGEWLKLHQAVLCSMYPGLAAAMGPAAPAPAPAPVPPASPPPSVGEWSWSEFASGAAEFAGVAWRTVARTAWYHTQRAAQVVAGGDPERVSLDGRDTLFDPRLVEDWGGEAEKQVAGRLAGLSAALDALPGGQVPSDVAGSAHRPSCRAEYWLPGVRAWMAQIGDYSRRLHARRLATIQLGEGYVIPPDWALAAREAEQDEIWLQALCLAGGMYVAGTCWPRLRGLANRKAVAAGLAAAAVETGTAYQTRVDPSGRTWIEPVRVAGSRSGSVLSRFWQRLVDAWRFRGGKKIDLEAVVADSRGAMQTVNIAARTGQGLSPMGREAYEQAILRVAESRLAETLAAVGSSPGGAGTVVNVSPTIGAPMLGPGANVAGLATGPASELAAQGARSGIATWIKILGAYTVVTSYISSVGYSMWAWEEGAQCYGQSAKQACQSKRPDLTQEAARGIAQCSQRIHSASPWIPGLNVLDAWKGFGDAGMFQAQVFMDTANGVAPLSPDALTAQRAKPNARPSFTAPAGPAPGGPAKVPPPPKGPEPVAPAGAPVPIGSQVIRSSVLPSVTMDAKQIAFIAADNRETVLLQEYDSYFAQGSRLLWSDENFAWPARARSKGGAAGAPVVNTGPALRVYLLPDGRVILRLPKEHALFGPIKDRMRRAKARKAATFLPGISDLTRSTGLWLIAPEAHGILGEILLNTNDVPVDQLSETERELSRIVSSTDPTGEDWVIEEPPRPE